MKQTLKFFLAWIFLNILINFNYPAPESHLLAPLRLSWDMAGLLTILCAAVWLGMPLRLSVYLPLTVFIVLLRMFRIADVLVPFYFNRGFNLAVDARYVPDLFHLLWHTLSPVGFIGYSLLGLALLTAISWATWKSLATIHSYFTAKRHRIIFAVVMAILAGFSILLRPGQNSRHPAVYTPAAFFRFVEEINLLRHAPELHRQYAAIIRETAEKNDRFSAHLQQLAGAGVFLFFIESYGRTVFSEQSHLKMVAPVVAQFEKDLAANGFKIYANYLNAPTYGGASWLTHGTIASGVQVKNQMIYNLLLSSRTKTIAGYFNRAGYRTVSVMPATTWPWPEGEFFGYQKKYYARHFDYQGPRYGWSPMPDQYVLDYIYRNEIQSQDQPLFIEFVLISSHAPFHIHPPYLENWSKIGNGAVFNHQEPIVFPVTWPNLTNASQAYMSSIIYDLTVLRSFLTQFVGGDSLIIIMGDHQPNVQITGQGRSWSVPVHVISRSCKLLRPFVQRGYTPGLVPEQQPPHPGMESFLHNFLTDFSSPEPRRK